MNWNPWKRVRELEERLAYVENECHYLERLADEAVGRACEYFNRRMHDQIRQQAMTEQTLIDLARLSPNIFTKPQQ